MGKEGGGGSEVRHELINASFTPIPLYSAP